MEGASGSDPSISSKSKVFRYRDDFDFFGSPPSAEDGGFVQIDYTVKQKPRVSTFDRINRELSRTYEGSDSSGPVTPITPILPSEENLNSSLGGITLSVSEKGFLLSDSVSERAPEIAISASPAKEVTPLIILPLHFKGTRKETDSQDKTASELEPKDKKESSNSQLPVHSGGYKKISITDKLMLLSQQQETPYVTPSSTPFSTPLTTPQTSPKSQRKITPTQTCTGIVMEKPANTVNSYFYRGSFFGSNYVNSAEIPADEKIKKIEAKHMEINNDNAQAMKKRRPKPSNLREMNFWAPTSM